MRKLLESIRKKPFLSDSILMLFGVNLYSFGQMVFHLVVGRPLGPAGYSEVAVLLSILGIVIIIQQAFGLTIVKFVSSGSNEKIVVNFTRWIFLWSFWLGVILSISFLALSPFLVSFLHISHPSTVLILGPSIVLLVFFNSAKSVFQGLLKFKWYIAVHLSEVSIKLFLATTFIGLGWAVFGVMIAIVIAVLLASGLTYYSLKKYIIGHRDKRPDIVPIFKYSIPVFFLSVAFTSMYSMDVILVKHFFSADEAGLYAALAKLGSIAFFGAAPIASVMFPHISQKHAKKQPYDNIFYLSLILVLAISVPVVILYKTFSVQVIGLLFGDQFIDGSDILWYFGVYSLLLGLALLLTQFYLSIGKVRIVFLFMVAALLQIILISLVHQSLLSVVQVSIFAIALFVGILVVYFPYRMR